MTDETTPVFDEMPLLVVDFSEHYDPKLDKDAADKAGKLIDAVGKVTSLQVPHRLADAILRDSELGGIAFRVSDKGRALNQVSLANATPIFELCPTGLVFGMWDSTGPKGGLGPKFERTMVSEIVGVGAEVGDLRRGVRRDPFEIRAAVKVDKAPDKSWTVAEPKAKGTGIDAPSGVNHSSIIFPEQRAKKTDENTYDGVTIEYAMAQAGEIPAFKIRGQGRIKRAELDQWIAAQARSGDGGRDGG